MSRPLTEALRAALYERLGKATPAPAFPKLGAEYRAATYVTDSPLAVSNKQQLISAQAAGGRQTPHYNTYHAQAKQNAGMTGATGTAYASPPAMWHDKRLGAAPALVAAKTTGAVAHHEDYHEALSRVQAKHGPTARSRAAQRAYDSMDEEARHAANYLLQAHRPDLSPGQHQHAEEAVAHMIQYANDPIVRRGYHQWRQNREQPQSEMGFSTAIKRGLRQVRQAAATMRPVHLLLPPGRQPGPLLR